MIVNVFHSYLKIDPFDIVWIVYFLSSLFPFLLRVFVFDVGIDCRFRTVLISTGAGKLFGKVFFALSLVIWWWEGVMLMLWRSSCSFCWHWKKNVNNLFLIVYKRIRLWQNHFSPDDVLIDWFDCEIFWLRWIDHWRATYVGPWFHEHYQPRSFIHFCR